MALGQGTTGLFVALIVALSSGVAFIICVRELIREISTPARFDRVLRKNRNILLDDGNGFVVEDKIFSELLQYRSEAIHTKREWQDPSTYLFVVGFLAMIAAAGFIAGVSHIF